MSIIQKCIFVGADLQETVEGKSALQADKNFLKTLNTLERALFVPSFRRLPWGVHFRAKMLCVELFKANTENEHIGREVKNLLENPLLGTIVETSNPLILFVDYLDSILFQTSVPYTLPTVLHATPNLVRSVQDLMVECQKIGYVQQLMQKIPDGEFMERVRQYDNIIQQYERKPPYSRGDRKIVKAMIRQGCSVEDAELIHSFTTLKTLIAQTIYDSFMNHIFYLDESDDVLRLREHRVKNVTAIKIHLMPQKSSLLGGEKWVLAFRRKDNSRIYGQIYSKRYYIEKAGGREESKISALIFHLL